MVGMELPALDNIAVLLNSVLTVYIHKNYNREQTDNFKKLSFKKWNTFFPIFSIQLQKCIFVVKMFWLIKSDNDLYIFSAYGLQSVL